MRVEVAASNSVNELDFFTVRDPIQRSCNSEIRPVRPFNDPPVVDIFSLVASNLLLVAGSALVGVLDRVLGIVTVEPARRTVTVPQRDL